MRSPAHLARDARRAGRGPLVGVAGRAGLAAKGISYALVAALAIHVALGGREATRDRSGALRAVAGEPFGRTLLIGLAVGFACYAVWRLAQALLDRDDEGSGPTGLAKRAGYVGRAAIYVALLVSTLAVLNGDDGGGGSTSEEDRATAGALNAPGGRWLVIAVGVAVGSIGAFNIYRALTQKFREKLATEEMRRAPRRLATALGVVGMSARGIVFAIAGWFLIKAALEYRASEAVGLDGALAKLAGQPHGPWLLGVVAAGLLAYGAYCLFEARYRDV